MSTKNDRNSIFKDAKQLHEALIDYACQALEGAFVNDLLTNEQRALFMSAARERMAQIAGALALELDLAAEDEAAARVTIDGKPLSSVEEAIYGAAFSVGMGELIAAGAAVRRHRKLLEIERSRAGEYW